MNLSLWQSVQQMDTGQDQIRRRRYGVIETSAGNLTAIHFRPWPKLLAWPEIWPVGSEYHPRGQADRCLLYYNQPLRSSNFLALKYMVTTASTPFATFRAALTTLYAIAQLKQTDAIVCDVSNSRISDRVLARFGWHPHCQQRWHRNFIKRFYGQYPGTSVPSDASTVAPVADLAGV